MEKNGKHDLLTHRIVIGSLALAVLISLGLTAMLSGVGRPVPEVLPAICYTAIGSLVGLARSIMNSETNEVAK